MTKEERILLFCAVLSNPNICTGSTQDWQLQVWFGKNASGITKEQILVKQAEAVVKECERVFP